MGFLDKKDRIIDLVLTERGRQLYGQGLLEFTYFAVFDDGLDYDPVPSTGTLTDDQREQQMETSLVMEAPYVRSQRGSSLLFEPLNHVFTAADGFSIIPKISSPATGSFEIVCDQYPGSKTGAKYTRSASTVAKLGLELDGDVEAGNPGFMVKVFVSGSTGLQELEPIRDSDFRRAFDPFIACSIDAEPLPDVPDPNDPRSFRR